MVEIFYIKKMATKDIQILNYTKWLQKQFISIHEAQLSKDIFNKFQTTGRQLKSKKSKIINIDKMPNYINFNNENKVMENVENLV